MVLLLATRLKASYLFGGLALLFLVLGYGKTEELFASFATPSIVAIFLLIWLTAVLRTLYDVNLLLSKAIGKAKSPTSILARLLPPIAFLSGFINNTPLVALLTPDLTDWAEHRKISASKLLIPLSYATLAGGMLTLIGTSTNLVLNGLLSHAGEETLGFFDFLLPGISVVLPVLLLLIFVAPRLLPNRLNPVESFRAASREYVAEMNIRSGSPILGKTIEEAGLRNLPGVFLAEIRRQGDAFALVKPTDRLQTGDVLVFVGEVANIATLLGDRFGLEVRQSTKLDEALPEVIEAMVPYSSSLVNRRVRDTGFRQRFDAAILAIHRNGERLPGRIGDVELRPGDLLLLIPGKEFHRRLEGPRDLMPLETHRTPPPQTKRKRHLFWLGTLGLLAPMLAGFLSFNLFLLILTAFLLATGLLTKGLIQKNLNMELWVMLGSALFLGQVMITTGAAHLLIEPLLSAAGNWGLLWALAITFVAATLLTNVMSNAAAVGLLFPLVLEWVHAAGLPLQPMMLALAFGASCAFLLPVAYQTHMIVAGPGGYRNSDFLRVGLPVTLVYAIAALGAIFVLSS